MSKESRREYFNKLILRPELFRFLTDIVQLYDYMQDSLQLKQTGRAVAYVDGKPKIITSELELQLPVKEFLAQTQSSRNRLRESGVYFLVPRKLQAAINNLWSNLPEEFTSVTDADIEKYEELMDELRDCLTKELGID